MNIHQENLLSSARNTTHGELHELVLRKVVAWLSTGRRCCGCDWLRGKRVQVVASELK